MAAKQQAVHDEISERFLSCSICLELYKNARILQCYHSFCIECLAKYVGTQQVFKCPLCQQNCDTPKDGVSSLPASTHINGIIELLEKRMATVAVVPSVSSEVSTATTSKQTGALCELCEEASVSFWCVDCGLGLCSPCTKVHRKVILTKSHTLMTIAEYETAKTNDPSSVAPPVKCPSHPAQQFSHFCDTCLLPICITCLSQTHGGHVIYDILDYIKTLGEQTNDISEKEIEAKQFCQFMQSSYERVEEQVIAHSAKEISNFTAMVKKQETTLLKILRTEKDEVCDYIRLDIQDFAEKLKYLRSRKSALVKLTSQCDVEREKDVRNDESGKLPEDYHIPEKYLSVSFPTFTPATFVAQGSLGNIQTDSKQASISSGSITRGPTQQSDFAIKMIKPVRVGETIDCIHIQHRGSGKGKPLVLSDMKAQVKEPDGNIRNVGQNLSKDLWFNLQFSKAGCHEFSMTLGNTPVHRSPYVFDTHTEWKRKRSFKGPSYAIDCPRGVAVDMVGNVFIADCGVEGSNKRGITVLKGNDEVREVKHMQLTGFGESFCPVDIAISESGRQFIADQGNNQIIVIDEVSQCEKGVECFGKTEIGCPKGIAVNEAKNVAYVTDDTDHIKIYNARSPFSLKKSKEILLTNPNMSHYSNVKNSVCIGVTSEGVAVVTSDWCYNYDIGYHLQILQLVLSDRVLKEIKLLQHHIPITGMAIDKYDDIYLCHITGILKYSKAGQHICTISLPNQCKPYSIAVSQDPLPKLWTTDEENKCVHLIS